MKQNFTLLLALVLLLTPVSALAQINPCNTGGACPIPVVNCNSLEGECQENGVFGVAVSDAVVFPPPNSTQLAQVAGWVDCECDANILRQWTTESDGGDPPILSSKYRVWIEENCGGTTTFLGEASKRGCYRLKQQSPIVGTFSPGANVPMTSAEDGVDFDLESTGYKLRLGWTRPDSDEAWLVTLGVPPINGKALWGNLNPQAPAAYEGEPENGYRALRLHDSDNDSKITPADHIYNELGFWFDRDHDAQEDPGEVLSLPSLGVTAISLEYKTVGTKDQLGNYKHYRSDMTLADGTKRTTVDVFPDFSSTLTAPMLAGSQRLNARRMYSCVDRRTGLPSFTGWFHRLVTE